MSCCLALLHWYLGSRTTPLYSVYLQWDSCTSRNDVSDTSSMTTTSAVSQQCSTDDVSSAADWQLSRDEAMTVILSALNPAPALHPATSTRHQAPFNSFQPNVADALQSSAIVITCPLSVCDANLLWQKTKAKISRFTLQSSTMLSLSAW